MKFIGNYKKRVLKNKMLYLPSSFSQNIKSRSLYGFFIYSNITNKKKPQYAKLVLKEFLGQYIDKYNTLDLIVKQQQVKEYKISGRNTINIGISNKDVALRGCGEYIEVIWQNDNDFC